MSGGGWPESDDEPQYWSGEDLLYRRGIGRGIDLLIGLGVTFLVAIPFGLDNPNRDVDYITTALTLLVWAVYEIGLLTSRGQTLGMMLAGVQVVDVRDESLPSYGAAFVRWLILAVALVFFLVPFLIVGISPVFDRTKRHQGWHDKAARTRVVRVRPLIQLRRRESWDET